MKPFFYLLLFIATCNTSFAQTNPPAGITFQAMAIDDNGMELSGVDAGGIPIPDKAIKVKFSILGGSATGSIEYSEEHLTNTDKYGIFTLIIGNGTINIGKDLKSINWHTGIKFLKVELDLNNGKGYKLGSVQQMLSVPYALYAGESLEAKQVDTARIRDSVLHSYNIKQVQAYLDKHIAADLDTVPTNELQNISINGGTIQLSQSGGSIKLPDSSAINEIQTLSIAGNKLSISGNGGNTVTLANQFEHYIGEYFGGGIIFHLWKDKNVEHGLIVNLNNQSTSQKWSNINSSLVGILAQSSWNGEINSNAIVNQLGHTNSAAQLCLNLNTDGYNDWYLPSIDELNLLWQNRFNVNATLNGMSGVTQIPQLAYFWSSGEYSNSEAWVFLFDVGYAGGISKSNSYYVRAIRKF